MRLSASGADYLFPFFFYFYLMVAIWCGSGLLQDFLLVCKIRGLKLHASHLKALRTIHDDKSQAARSGFDQHGQILERRLR